MSELISILIPIYNVEKYIRRCIDSVIGQTYKNLEIICLDDGSTDGCPAILDEYAARDKRIRVIHKANSGYGHSMNVGLQAANGKYIGIVESDDYVESDMFESLLTVAENNGCDIVKSQFVGQYEDYATTYETFSGLPCDEVVNPFVNLEQYISLTPSIWAAVYRREFLLENNIWFNETPGAAYQDTAFVIKGMMMAQRMVCLKEAFLHYTMDNPGSSVHQKNKVYCLCKEYDSVLRYARDHGLGDDVYAIAVMRKYQGYLYNYVRIGREFKAEFLGHFIDEFVEHAKEDALVRKYWQQSDWEELQKMLSDKEGYMLSAEDRLSQQAKVCSEFRDKLAAYSTIYVYGAGRVAIEAVHYLQEDCAKVRAMVVTSSKGNAPTFNHKPVIELKDLPQEKDAALFIVAVGEKWQSEIVEALKSHGINDYVVMTADLRQALAVEN